MDLLLAVEYFAIAPVYLPNKSKVSTQRLDRLWAACNTLEAGFEVGGKLNPVICRNTEPLQNRWGRSVYSATFVISDNSASPVNQLNVVDKIEDCLLYTSPSPRDQRGSRMPSSA